MYIKVARFKYFKPGNFTLILCKLYIELVIIYLSCFCYIFYFLPCCMFFEPKSTSDSDCLDDLMFNTNKQTQIGNCMLM